MFVPDSHRAKYFVGSQCIGKAGISATTVCATNYANKGVVTFVLKYPRLVHSEFMTHRVFSKNSGSSRAIPTATIIDQVWNDAYIPFYIGKNKPGMQATEELFGWRRKAFLGLWKTGSKLVCAGAYLMNKVGAHKQLTNRILETFQYITVVMTTTDIDNYFHLRDHPDAQPDIRELARCMKSALANTKFRDIEGFVDETNKRHWHLPFITDIELDLYSLDQLKKISTARNARTSYLKHDKAHPLLSEDIDLHNRLVGSEPLHASPAEHLCYPCIDGERHANFDGWIQYRKELEMNTNPVPEWDWKV